MGNREIDPGPLIFFRIAFGGLMALEVCRYFAHGWIGSTWLETDLAFKYYGFEWIGAWPGDGLYWHFAGLGVAALCMALGLFYRAASAIFFLGFSYVFLLEQAAYLNHFYLICLLAFLMIFLSPERWCSLDDLRRPSRARRAARAWELRLLQGQVALVYVFAGIAKLNPDWLRGAPMDAWLRARSDLPVLGPMLDQDWAGLAFSYGGLLFDFGIVPALLWRRTRWLAFAVAVVFHGLNAWLFSIGIFPWLMIAATALFLPSSVFSFLSGSRAESSAPPPFLGRAGRAALITWFALQLAIPLRHHLYPGDVAWTEEGHRFAWRMKLRDKEGIARFLVTDAAGRVLADVDPRDELRRWQHEELAGRPDLVLQYAQHLQRRFAARGQPDARVLARVSVSLNHRPRALLIDPLVDLGSKPRSLASADWILPMHEPASP